MSDHHIPVLFEDVMQGLHIRPGGAYIDGTLGAGGHAAGILARSGPGGRLLGFDADPSALAIASERLAAFGDRVTFVHANFAQMGELAPAHGFGAVDGILLDIGMSSMMIDDAERGFSYSRDGPLDMRFDSSAGRTAADLLNTADEAELVRILREYGEEPNARRVARAIIDARPLTRTRDLAEVAMGAARRERRLHPARRTFQAIRIALNRELDVLRKGLEAARDLLKPGGRLAVIAFHSLEDRIVKNYLRDEAKDCICSPKQPICTCDHRAAFDVITRKPIMADDAEIERNPRSSSARLRVAEKLPPS
jgi:16S rRNA (cytosine1402-N4)-methyltransferase